MKTRIVYSRDFLLSFGELEHCKKLPSGFDTALLSELQELSAGVLERDKGYYNTSQGRPDGSGGGYTYSSRGGNTGGRWDTRSSGSSDRDGELPDRESQTQGRGGSQYRRNWQNTEHDGLLGSGGFPRPSGYAGQLSSKDHGNAPQLNRTSERYQPPRPYKAAPFSRKDIDSMNDETFGSSELSNEDRAEEERKRRASFELMRKEQHKAMQGKKNGPDILKENPSDDIMSQLQTSTAKANAKTKNEKLDSSVVSSYQEDTTKPSSVLLAPAARPLVPPGFATAFADKKLQPQLSNITHEPKCHNATTEANMLTVARLGGQLEGDQSATEFTSESKEKGLSNNVAIMGPKHTLPAGGVTSSAELPSTILKGSEDWEADVMDKYSIGKEGKSKNIDPIRKDDSVSILEQFFGNVLSKSGSNLPTYVENQPLKTDDDMIASSVPESSKFARWFLDEDLKPAEDLSSKSLLSMIVKNENPGPENIIHAPLSDAAVQNLSPKAPIGKLDSASKLISFTSPTPADGILEQYIHSDIPEAVPVMMTCEDLEQTMLAQVSNSSSTQINATNEQLTVMDEPVAMQKVAVDNHASQHLLSLLQKGIDNKGAPLLGFHRGLTDEPQSVGANLMANGGISGSDLVNSADNVPTSGKNLTLEALFGAAFMNELHSKDAPVSIRGSTTGGPTEFAETGKTLLSSSHEGYYPVEQTLHFNNTKDIAVPREPGIEHSAVPGLNQGSASFDKKGMEIHLPEEENLFTMSDSLPGQNSDILASVGSVGSSRVEGLLPEKAVDDLSYRFQSLVPGDAEHIQVLVPDALGSHPRDQRYQVDSQNLYHLLQGRPPMMAPRPMMDHIVNRKQPAPFDMPQSIHHDSHHSFPSNVNPMQHNLHGPGVPHLDPNAHIMLQHMSMPGRFPPEGLPRGVAPSQPVHHMAGYRPEMGNVNNFHMHPRQPNYGEFGLMMPGPSGPEVRGNHPEAFERLIQMEMSARSKQQQVHHPGMAAGRVPSGMYGHELDAKLRYR